MKDTSFLAIMLWFSMAMYVYMWREVTQMEITARLEMEHIRNGDRMVEIINGKTLWKPKGDL